ncbi:MAG: type II secretion system F family protein [Gammaproteobacteria bacterium]|nr:type II secretion system F family protein [Gammaproteobacteria bacterium]
MPLFHYRALTANGRPIEGEMEAASEPALIAHLKDTGYLPVSARPVAAGRRLNGGLLARRHRLSRAQLTLFTRELSRLIGAGVSLDRSLTILASVADGEVERRMITHLLEAIRGGGTFAGALESQGSPFSRLYISMVKAGEEGGALKIVLDRLADYLEKSRELRASIGAALIYPTILLVVSVLSLVLLLTLVVPQFQRMFDEAGAALPVPTQVVISISGWLQSYWWVLLVLIMVLVVAIPRILARPDAKLAWDRMWLSVGGIGPLIQKIEVSRFCRTLSTLLGNGVALLTALSIVREILGNRHLAQSVDSITESLKKGDTLSAPMLSAGVFPKLACHMVRVGEETGRLDAMLMDVADVYDGEVASSLRKMLSLLEPLLILTLGVLIAGIIFSILLALLSVNELAF